MKRATSKAAVASGHQFDRATARALDRVMAKPRYPCHRPLLRAAWFLQFVQTVWGIEALRRLLATAAAFALCVLAHAALAAPPPPGSDDEKIMKPYAEWVTTQHDSQGRWCCDIGDGRPVEARISGDHWEAHITPEHWPGEKDRWVPVPDDRVTRGVNPMGSPILWLYHGAVQCFAPPDGA